MQQNDEKVDNKDKDDRHRKKKTHTHINIIRRFMKKKVCALKEERL